MTAETGTGPEEETRPRSVAAWLLPAHFVSAIPWTIVGSTLAFYAKATGMSLEEALGGVGAVWVTWQLVALWVVPLEFLARKRTLMLALQACFVVLLLALSLSSFFRAPALVMKAIAWAFGFCGASHDAAMEGLYVSELKERAQIKYQIIAPIFSNLGRMAIMGFLVVAVDEMDDGATTYAEAWAIGFGATAMLVATILFWQSRALPNPERDEGEAEAAGFTKVAMAMAELARRPLVWKMLLVVALVGTPARLVSDGLYDFVAEMAAGDMTRQGELVTYTMMAPLFGTLGGMLWILSRGLERVFVPASFMFGIGSLFGLVAAVLGPQADQPLLVALLFLGQLPLALAVLVTTLYAIQQLAPGRFSMSAYVIATTTAQLVMMPLRPGADYIHETVGFVWLFIGTSVLSVLAIVLARWAPFVHKYR